MVRSILTTAALFVAGLAGLASAATYEDYELDTTVAFSYAGPLSVIQSSAGSLAETKAACDAISDCIAVLYQESASGANLLRYDAGGSAGAQAGYSAVSWKYDAAEGPSCNIATDTFANNGACDCNALIENQNTAFGCSALLTPLPSGIIERRGKRMTRKHIMPGRAATPAFM